MFGRNKTKGPKQYSHNQLRSPMTEEHLKWIHLKQGRTFYKIPISTFMRFSHSEYQIHQSKAFQIMWNAKWQVTLQQLGHYKLIDWCLMPTIGVFLWYRGMLCNGCISCEWELLNAKWAIFQLYHGQEQIIFQWDDEDICLVRPTSLVGFS